MFFDRFGDFSDFIFFFVGNFDEQLLEDYCKIYLANLPSEGRKDKIIDAGIRTFKGQQSSRFAKGSSESAYVANVSTGAFKATDDNKVAMSAMLLVLNDKLRENIREQMSGVYAIQAWQEYIDQPKPAYLINIWMSCSPDRVDELNTAIVATIDSLRRGDFADRYLVSSKAVLERRYEENISQNRYWLGQMIQNHFGIVKLDSFLNHPQRYAKIDKKMVSKAAKNYLLFDKNKLSVIMVPQKVSPPQE